ncbi:MAG: pyrophosphokinae [Acidobacteriota bacterium]|jgi:ppGpp synthetase/RelA/SpoT-type nucleotidyltranferase|nr:pyrophosphokinae [Acidobacteriota bacterium]
MSDSHTTILVEYERLEHLYAAFATRAETLIREILIHEQIVVHSVTSRAKAVESLRRKLTKKGAAYSVLNDVTDLAGIRITTFFAEDVDKVATIIEREFTVDQVNTTDKRVSLDPDRFGYLSLHHVVSLHPSRQSLAEYRRFPAMKAEIQTRSILQHAWAEIEHDLGYKAKHEIPRHVRRRFSRIAGLLELADDEFAVIRRELVAYETAVPEEIEGILMPWRSTKPLSRLLSRSTP